MDTFFRRHFKRKDTDPPAEDVFCCPRRPSVAVPTSKARRRSSVGLPSAALAQRRRSSVGLQGPQAGGGRLARVVCYGKSSSTGRRRSSTTTPSMNPRFAVRRRKAGKLRTIDTHLLGPSMLLASLIQMTEEDEEGGGGGGGPSGEPQVEVRGDTKPPSPSSTLHSDGDATDFLSSEEEEEEEEASRSEGEDLLSEEELSDREIEDTSWWLNSHPSCSTSPLGALVESVPSPSRPLIRAPRCLRRNSSRMLPGDVGRYMRSSQRKRRRLSHISKVGSPWPGRGPPMPSRRSSVYLHHPSLYRGPGALSPGLGAHYDPRLESWTGFLL